MNNPALKIALPVLLSIMAAAARAEDVVRLGNLRFVHYGAVSYMKEVCPKYGIRVEERMFQKGVDILPAISAGELDMGALASDGAILGRANGLPIYVVAGFARGGARIVAGVHSGIKRIEDLKGRKVGVTPGGAQEVLLYAELKKAGLTWSDKPGRDVQIVFLPFADLNPALANRQVDAMCQSEPQSSQAINGKIGVEVKKPYDTAMDRPSRLLVMTEKFYSQHKDLARRTLKCFVEATAAFRQDTPLASRYVREQMFKGQLTAQDFKDAMDNAEYTYDVTPLHVDITAQFMSDYGVGRMPKLPKAAEWVKLDLLQKAKADLHVK